MFIFFPKLKLKANILFWFFFFFFCLFVCFLLFTQGRVQMLPPTTMNYVVQFPTFKEIADVSTLGVQRMSLALGKAFL